MNFSCNLRHPLRRDGTNQYQRLLDALRPENAPIDGRGMRERLRFAVDYATKVQFYDLAHQPSGDWKDFFDAQAYLRPELDDAAWAEWFQGLDGSMQPHMALFFSFLELLQVCVDHLNTLTQRHLDFYYRSILALPVRPPKPDEVHALLELAQHTQRLLLPEGSRLDAGKDDAGRQVAYRLGRETVAGRARVAQVRSLHVDVDRSTGERIYYAPDARSRDGHGLPLEGPSPNWRLMGQPQRRLAPAQRTMADAQVGWMVCSPVLALAEGQRSIALTMDLDGLQWTHGGNGSTFTNSEAAFFTLELSTDAGWLAVPFAMRFAQAGTQHQLVLDDILLPATTPAITKGNAKQLGIALDAPALRLRVRPRPEPLPYRDLARARVQRVEIAVAVEGMQKLDLRGEAAQHPSGAPFLPFGVEPQLGERLYVGCPEALGKPLQRLRLDLEWADLPADLPQHYAAYAPVARTDFQCGAALLQRGEWRELRSNIPLFPVDGSPMLLHDSQVSAPLPQADYAQPLPLSTPVPMQHCGYLRLALSGPGLPGLTAFGHRDYSPLLMRRVSHNSQPGATQLDLPLQPYTPKLRSLKLSYAAREVIGVGAQYSALAGQFWHVEPSGWQRQPLEAEAPQLLPQYVDEGYVYLGLAEAEAGSTVSLLFQFAEGSGNNWLDMDDAQLRWSYLDGQDWRALPPANVVFEGTMGMLQSGIVTIGLPQDIAPSPLRMGDGLHWLRLSLDRHVAGLPSVIGVHAQAVHATWDGEPALATHLEKPLLGGRNLRMNPQPQGLKAATMPYSSFGGRAAEGEAAYYTRVSERLRHKQRAITIWDYERLVLEAFPEIYKVKCIPHSSRDAEFVAGSVAVIVVPQLRNVNAVDPLRPAVGQGRLRAIQRYLSRFNPSLFVEVLVENPSYEAILVECKVGFHPGYDAGYYGQLLNERLKRFLAPWAFEEGQDIVFGGTIHKSAIIKFIEDQYYVDFVVDFVTYQNTNDSAFAGINWMEIECNFIVSAPDVQVMQASSERSVLISAQTHRITVLEPGVYPCAGQAACTLQ